MQSVRGVTRKAAGRFGKKDFVYVVRRRCLSLSHRRAASYDRLCSSRNACTASNSFSRLLIHDDRVRSFGEAGFFAASYETWNGEYVLWQSAESKLSTSKDRTLILNGLKSFYTEANDLFIEGINAKSDEAYKAYSDKVEAFSNRLEKWTVENMECRLKRDYCNLTLRQICGSELP
jgi:hypothetical protein